MEIRGCEKNREGKFTTKANMKHADSIVDRPDPGDRSRFKCEHGAIPQNKVCP